MTEENKMTYQLMSFEGLGGYVWGEWRTKKISLADYLKQNRFYCNTTKDFFEMKDTQFNSKWLTIEEIEKAIEKKIVIFPINSSTYVNEIENYISLGFSVRFMKDRDFHKMKKEYAKIA